MRILYVMVVVLGLLVFDVSVQKVCEINYIKIGSFFFGCIFIIWDVVFIVILVDVFKCIQIEGVKFGLKVVSVDKDLGMLILEQNVQFNGGQIILLWNVLVEVEGKGFKIIVIKIILVIYVIGEDFQKKLMCGVIEVVVFK